MIRHFEKLGTFHKVEGDTAYGWALVSSIEGVPYFDTGDGTHSDHIPEESLPEVAAEFMKAYGAGLDMHKGDRIADVLFAYPMTTDIMKGVEVSSNKTGLLIGWQPYDKSILEKISDGERIGFSIGGLVSEWDIVDADGKVIETVLAAGKQAGKPFGLQLTKGYDGKGKMKRRVFRSWKLHEVSLVDRPMQEGALVGIVKSADGSVPYRKLRSIARAFSKGALLTSVVDGHQHVVDPACCDENGIGRTSYEKGASDEYGHDHAFVRKQDGSYEIAANGGHSHAVETPKLADGAPSGASVSMRAHVETPTGSLPSGSSSGSVADKSGPTETKNMITEQEHEALKKKALRLEKMAELTDAQRAYAKSLNEGDLEVFLAKSAVDRQATLKAAVAYEASDGTVFYTHDDARMIQMAKRADAAEKDSGFQKALASKATFEKSAAEDMSHYPEDGDVHAAVIEAIETSIKDPEMKKKARSLVKAGDAALAKAGMPTGISGVVKSRPGDAGNVLKAAEDELKVAVEAFGKSKGITNYQLAFAEATGSDPASRAAYAKVRELRQQDPQLD
jgi:hypothetical protein